MQCGGFSKIAEINGEHLEIANSKRAEIEQLLNVDGDCRIDKIEHFEVLEVHQQVVAGMCYLFKIKLQEDGDECAFVKIFQDLKLAFNKDEFASKASLEYWKIKLSSV